MKIILILIGLGLAMYLVQNPQLLKIRAGINYTEAFEFKDSSSGKTIYCRPENGEYLCSTDAKTISLRLKDAGILEGSSGGRGCSGDDGSPCYNPNPSQRVSLDSMYDTQFAADCKGCKMPTKRIPYIYDQTDVSVPEFSERPEWRCLATGRDTIGKSTCGPTSLAMVAESFNGHDGSNQTANNLSRFFLHNNLMQCTVGTIDENILNYSKLINEARKTLQVEVLDISYGSYSDLENWYNSTGYPTWVGVWYLAGNGQASAHYATVAGISDNYVWLADPYKPDGQTVLKIDKDDFANIYYRRKFWKIAPVGPVSSQKACPAQVEIDHNSQSRNSCRDLNPNIDIFDTNVPASLISRFVDRYSRGNRDEFARRTEYLFEKSKQAGINPVLLMGYWSSESAFSTISNSRDLGCAADALTFESQVDCALGIGEYSDPIKNPISNCARSRNENSPACRELKRLRNTPGQDGTNPISYPINTFDEFTEAYGPKSVLFSDEEKKGVNNNCIHTYNKLIEVAKQLGMCGG